jgi:arylsulfatase
MHGNRAIYHDGWLANTTPVRMPWESLPPKGTSVLDYQWELYDLRHDYSQTNNLAAKDPARLQELEALWDAEAQRNNVYPLDDRFGFARLSASAARAMAPARSFVYWGGDITLTRDAAPPLTGRSFTLTADIDVPAKGGNGVLVAYGSYFAGWSFYLKDGKPVAVVAHSQQPGDHWRVAADTALAPGPASVRYTFESDGGVAAGGTLRITVNDREVARGHVGATPVQMVGLGETFDTGRDTGAPVSDDYRDEGVFDGTIHKIAVDVAAMPMPAPVKSPD